MTPIYDITEGRVRVRAEMDGEHNARVTCFIDGVEFRSVPCLAYAVWNVPAHMSDWAPGLVLKFDAKDARRVERYQDGEPVESTESAEPRRALEVQS